MKSNTAVNIEVFNTNDEHLLDLYFESREQYIDFCTSNEIIDHPDEEKTIIKTDEGIILWYAVVEEYTV